MYDVCIYIYTHTYLYDYIYIHKYDMYLHILIWLQYNVKMYLYIYVYIHTSMRDLHVTSYESRKLIATFPTSNGSPMRMLIRKLDYRTIENYMVNYRMLMIYVLIIYVNNIRYIYICNWYILCNYNYYNIVTICNYMWLLSWLM